MKKPDAAFDLSRFLKAQEGVYSRALSELQRGRKETHWMWFIFPQLRGLGSSTASRLYALSGPEEARAYYAHPVLGPRLTECAGALLLHSGRAVEELLPYPDDLKLRSCATLFLSATEEALFARILDTFFHGRRDERTVALLGMV